MDSFYKLNGIPMSIIDLKGQVLVGVGWQEICSKFHRIHPDTCKGCIESDTELSKGISRGEFRLYKCKNNMWDIATPIIMGNHHVGNVFAGQFFFSDESLDYKLFRAQAKHYGFNEEEYIAALEAVPRLSKEAVDAGMEFFIKLADMISKLSYSNIKLARSLSERDRLMVSQRKSEARFQRLFNAVALPLCFVDGQGKLVNTNDRFVEIFGYTRKEVPTLEDWWKASCPDPEYCRWVQDAWNASLQRAMTNKGDIDPMEYLATCKNGKEHTLIISGIMIDDNFLATFYDITERKRSEETLRTNEARLANALKIASIGHWEYDCYRDMFAFNDQFYNVLRTTAEQEGGYTMSSAQYVERFVHPDDRSMVMKKFLRHLKTADDRHSGQLEHRMPYANGKSGYTSIRFFGANDGSSHMKIYGVNQDTTERKREERALEKREAQYQLIANNTTDFIWLYDLALNRFIYVSPSVEKLRGFTVKEALSQSMQAVLTPASYRIITESLPKRVTSFEAGDDSERTRTDEVGLIRKDGSIVITETVTTLICEKQNHVNQLQGISRDITERKSLQTQLLQAQKMEAIGRLAGGIAHDFNNLLTIILGYSKSLIDSFSNDDSVRSDLEHIRNAGNRATALTSMLLAFSRKQILQPKVVDLKTLILESIKLLRRLIGEDIELFTDLASDLGNVKVDSIQMDQVIMNLAINSRDAMPLGGKLILKARNVRLEQDNASEQAGFCRGEYVMLAISDTGMGMDSETKSHIFEPFFTTKAIGKGTGLGLATVYGIINQSGGSITVDSEPKRGATFTIYLPRVDRVDESIESCEVMAANGSETILLVEDDNEVRKLASLYLHEKGYTVLEADNGPNALSIAEEYGRTIDLLITDMVMPGGMNGIELIKSVQRSYPNIGTLVVTGYIGELTIGAQNLDSSYLQKPFTADDLTRKVWIVLQERNAQECQLRKSPKEESSIQSPSYCI
jgi:PAS domain S-box-containing protein